MIQIKRYNDIDPDAWKRLEQSSHTASWFQTKEAYDFFASIPTIMTPFGYGVCENDMLQGVCIGYITRTTNPVKQLFTRRAIIIGGPMLAESISEQALTALLQTVAADLNKRAIYIETRNFFDYSAYQQVFENTGWMYEPHLNFRVDTTTEETIQSHLGKGRKRDIKTSLRDGAEIVEQPTLEEVKAWYAILKDLYTQKVKTPLFDWLFFEKLYNVPTAHYILIKVNDAIVGGTLCVGAQGQPRYEWFVCGKDGTFQTIFPSSLATYAGMLYASHQESSYFDMMGAGVPDVAYGVREFKARFGGELVEYGRYKIINNKIMYKLGAKGVEALKNGIIRMGGVIKNNEFIEDWSSFVKDNNKGTIFQTPEMYQIYLHTKNYKPILYAKYDNNKLVGVLLVCLMWENGLKKPFSKRGIIIGGPIVAHENTKVATILLQAYEEDARKEKLIYTQVRAIYDMSHLKIAFTDNNYVFEDHLNLSLNVSQSEDNIRMGLNKNRKRNIQQAEKFGLRFEEINNLEQVEQGIQLIKRTYKRVKTPLADDSLFKAAWQYANNYIHCFAVYDNDTMIGYAMRLCYKELTYAWYTGSDETTFKKRPNDYLYYRTILWAHEHGYTTFDFGGGGNPNKPYSVRDYKLAFGCQPYNYGRWNKLHKPLLYKIGVLGMNILKKIP